MQYAVPLRHFNAIRPRGIRCPPTIKRFSSRHVGNTVVTSQPGELDESGAKTLRTRKYINTSLPLPPIIDPKAIESRQRYKTPKSRGYVGGKSELQKALYGNVFAQALASPIRQCSLTMAKLPTHFLSSFVGSIDVPSRSDAPSDRQPPRPKAHMLPQARALKSDPNKVLSRTTYVSNSYSTIVKLKTHPKLRPALVDPAMSEWYAKKIGRVSRAADFAKDFVWPEENADHVLAMLRGEATDKLRRVISSEPIANLVDVTTAGGTDRIVCLLKIQDTATKSEDVAQIPSFNLPVLLGDVPLNDIIQSQQTWAGAPWVAVYSYSHALELTLALLKLEQNLSPFQD